MERRVNSKTYYKPNNSGVRSISSIYPPSAQKNGTDGGRSIAMGNTQGELTTTTYIVVSVTKVVVGITIVDIERVVALRVIRGRRPIIVAIILP